MREIIDEILNGNYARETGSLDFSQASVELTALQGELTQGSFWVRGDGAQVVKGRVFSTDYRMECLTPEFLGEEAEITYVFHGEGAQPGEAISGAFRVISNLGEYSLPFVVNLSNAFPMSSLGPVTDLSQFVTLAKENWQEAVSLYYSPEFSTILSKENPRLMPIYRGLSVTDGQEQNVEDFLICAGEKQAVTYYTETPLLRLEMMPSEGVYQPFEQEFIVSKNGWGYVVLNVECEGDFLSTDREVICEEDFLGNSVHVPYYVDKAYLHAGENRGKIVLYNSFTCLEVPVTVKLGNAPAIDPARRQWKQTVVAIMQQYEKFRTRKIGLDGWMEQTMTLVERLVALDEHAPMPRLFKAQLLITQERTKEAQWLLEHAADLMESGRGDNELWAYYLYLTTLITRDDEQIDAVAREVETLYYKQPDSWRIAWLLLYLSQELSSNPSERLRFLAKQYDYGCRSFVIYLEALQIYLNNPAMIRTLGAFEQHVLLYGLRKDFFNQDMAERFLELMDKNKEYSPLLCRILERLYRKKKDLRIVSHMCGLLVKGGVLGKRALPWYERGVEEQLRITNLYESFMSSIDLKERKGLPKPAVLYFSLQNKLDYEHCAFLYDHVLDNKVVYQEVYDKYLLKSKDFVEQQIQRGRVNKHLARLYARLFTPEMVTEQNVDVLIRIVFAARIAVKDDRMKKVIVYAKGSILGREYPITGGEVIAPIFGKDSTLVFEDAFGNRFAGDCADVEHFLKPDLFAPELKKRNAQAPEFDLWLLDQAGDEPLDELLSEKALNLLSWSGLAPEERRKLSLRLLREYFESEQAERLEEVLGLLGDANLTLSERMEVSRYALLQGNYEKPYEWMQTYGPYFLDANTLARLTAKALAGEDGEVACLVAASNYLFLRGKANVAMLDYLSRYMQGTLKDLRDLWNALRENSLDVTSLEERILVQMIFTGGYIAERAMIFEDYDRALRDSDVSKAYVIQNCFDYFVRENTADEIIFRYVLDDHLAGLPVPKVCKLAFLKFYAENPAKDSREINAALETFLREMMAEKLHFEFYRKLKGQKHLLGELSDKVIVEYRTRPGGKARIHYVITQEGGATQDYLSETMRDVFWGICCKEFILFFGETLEYYVTEEIGGKETMTIRGKLEGAEADAESAGTKFGMINDMVISEGMGDGDALDEALESYYFKEFCGENLFRMR
ncbi:MAG: hypothetical protein J5546_10145 [Lachnospiraceae bacterium]|nr:hypothetical protein [Lachnospiraceae bacterium]